MAQANYQAQLAALYKTLYSDKRVARMAYENFALLQWMPKKEDFYGKSWTVPVISGLGGGRSHTFTDAQAGMDPTNSEAFEVRRVRDYSIISIDNETLEASEKDEGAFIEARKLEADAKFLKAWQSMARGVVGNLGGSVGRVLSAVEDLIAGTTAITLTNPDDVVNFERSDKLAFSTGDGTAVADVLKVATVFFPIIRRNSSDAGPHLIVQGLLITGGVLVPALAPNDFIFHIGDFKAAMAGLEAWVPPTDPGVTDSFFGVNRSVDPTRLAGMRFDGTPFSIPEALERATVMARREEAQLDAWWVSHRVFTNLSLELGAKAIREDFKVGEFVFNAIRMNFGGKPLPVMADTWIRDNTAWGLTKSTWQVKTLKKAPRFISDDYVEPTNDGVQLRIGWRGNVGCFEPGKNIRCALAV